MSYSWSFLRERFYFVEVCICYGWGRAVNNLLLKLFAPDKFLLKNAYHIQNYTISNPPTLAIIISYIYFVFILKSLHSLKRQRFDLLPIFLLFFLKHFGRIDIGRRIQIGVDKH